MVNKEMSGDVLSFFDLLEKHKIEIPKIQRDYAQGRQENKVIRIEFLNALKDSMVNSSEIKLDFIYGEIIGDTFKPLDGQQRLTTLYLLHWYAVAKDGRIREDIAIAKCLSKFTYETRLSTSHFCDNLINQPVVFSENSRVSEAIRDAHWFYMFWEKDPSISAMLNTLDDIAEIFSDIPDLWELLTGQKIITFHYLSLQDLGLSDDLYIKMNARGKLLTPFENFKAQLQKRIEDNKWESGYQITDKFDFNIDTVWNEFFWSKFKKEMDAAHIKFLSAIIMCKIALNRESTTLASKRHDDIRHLNDNSDGKYLLQFVVDKDVYNYIYLCYDIFTNADNDNIDLSISEVKLWSHSCSSSVLEEIANDSSYTKKALLFAQIEYLKRNKVFDRKAYLRWMRVIRNFVCYANITIKANSSREDLLRAPDAFDSMINLINTMAEGCGNIYDYLADLNVTSSYRKDQMDEEIKKAKKIRQNPNVCYVIWDFEDLDLFRGRISFIFDCVSSMAADENVSEEEYLKKLYSIFVDYFGKKFEAALFNRAMLTINIDNTYRYYDYWSTSRWYAVDGQKGKFVANLTDLNFLIYNERTESEKYLLKLILLLFEKDYCRIINEFIPPKDMPIWKVKLIKESSWFEERLSDFFAITDDNLHCYLLKSQRPINEDGGILVQ